MSRTGKNLKQRNSKFSEHNHLAECSAFKTNSGPKLFMKYIFIKYENITQPEFNITESCTRAKPIYTKSKPFDSRIFLLELAWQRNSPKEWRKFQEMVKFSPGAF